MAMENIFSPFSFAFLKKMVFSFDDIVFGYDYHLKCGKVLKIIDELLFTLQIA